MSKSMSIQLTDPRAHGGDWWRELIRLFLRPGEPFELRCWREEDGAIRRAGALGTVSPERSTDYETAFTGTLTEAVGEALLAPSEAEDRETDFFTIFLGDRFSSEHYGTELFVRDLREGEEDRIRALLSPVRDFFSCAVFETN